jgi:hypothetical protein
MEDLIIHPGRPPMGGQPVHFVLPVGISDVCVSRAKNDRAAGVQAFPSVKTADRRATS